MTKLRLMLFAASVAAKGLLIDIGVSIRRCINAPYLIYFSVTYDCNAKCITCLRWQIPPQKEELSFEECKKSILQLRRWVGPCNISFTGGEPFIKEGFYELLEYANALGLCTTVSTNGIVFDERTCDRVIKTGVNSLIFSLNSIDCAVHDQYKGQDGLHRRIVDAIQYIKKKNPHIRIGVLCLITKDTYRSLDDFAGWARRIGADSIDFQPILDIHPPGFSMSSPTSDSLRSLPLAQIENLAILDAQIDLLIQRKKRGFPIVIPAKDLQAIKLFFRDISRLPARSECNVGFRNLYIAHDGSIRLCPWYPAVGTIRGGTLRSIWFSREAQRQRIELLKCQKPCLAGCMREYTFKEKLFHFLKLIR